MRSTPKGTAACRAAPEIARRIGNDSYQAKALLALWNGCFATGEVRHSLELAEEFMGVAARLGRADVPCRGTACSAPPTFIWAMLSPQGGAHGNHGRGLRSDHAWSAHMARFSFGQLASGF